MTNSQRSFQKLFLVFGLFVFLSIVFGGEEALAAIKVNQADVIYISSMKRVKKQLEMPPAVFLHDQHTQALSDQSCKACHDTNNKERPFEFVEYKENMTSEDMEDAYHNLCIGCHLERERKGLSFGPLTGQCRDCHDTSPKYIPADKNVSIQSKPFHFVHVYSKEIKYPGSEENCGVCHHRYDPKLRKLVWKKGLEESCSTCHGEQAEDEKPSLKTASHKACVGCHLKNVEKMESADKPFSGPISCVECHSGQTHIAEPTKDIPRLMRGQPDAVVLLPIMDTPPTNVNTFVSGMKPVIFNHKAHEAVTESCSVCHHVQISSCLQCHTVDGRQVGGFVTLAEAMHDRGSIRSCIGCHQKYLMEKNECSGCHVLVKSMQPNGCATCHRDVKGIPLKDIVSGKVLTLNHKQLEAIAQKNLAEIKPSKPLSPLEIPETVTISVLSQDYEPCVMPHRKIYEALLQGIEKSGLAGTFHSSPTAVCAACHHNSPVAELRKPPKCSDCHNPRELAVDENKPSLKAAYHQQCMACHEEMRVKPEATNCIGCHVVKH